MKEEDYKEIYHHLWNQYRLRFDSLERKEQTYSLLLAFLAILFLVILELKLHTIKIFYFPIFFLFISLLVILYQLVPRKIWVPWHSENELEELIKNGNFWKGTAKDIYGVEKHLDAGRKNKNIVLMLLINLISIGLLGVMVAASIYYDKKIMTMLAFLVSSLFLILLNLKFGKEYL